LQLLREGAQIFGDKHAHDLDRLEKGTPVRPVPPA
jgi:hypothetical protein